ncbi:hypothetical protein HYALB_00012322 [Hymenoscyphus albidus]|uniref:Xylanolytic transcriptional activator regulatory domain-containing protein n=1 Tax=Hymenoscyphus albidus TaxID=595503 RepID=A0A9N9LI80_9HELO|nr:hypothetical protein HYALB_00012322 [Hymenoscyphus albidus]
MIHGNAIWRLHHDLVAMGTALGLHCYPGTPEFSIHSELTKRVSALLFKGDKEIALFTGRPPALTRHYQTCPLPLDISDAALLTGGDLLQREIDNLDGNWWNRDGRLHSATLIRNLLMVSIVHDEVMELFVANNGEQTIHKERVEALKGKTAEIYQSMPSFRNFDKEGLVASLNASEKWRVLVGAHLHLDYLRVHLDLERLSTERGYESKEKLHEIARELVEIIVFFWRERDRVLDKQYNYDFMIMSYGMPSTGILCAGLLKQTQYPSQVPPSMKLPTSEVVQNLSLMMGFLEWVRPHAGSYKLCQRMAKVIRRVLDRGFEPTLELMDT